jgi:predicted regulator of Ras-like GTPase activity (Roadblock/LC7/MglB family)
MLTTEEIIQEFLKETDSESALVMKFGGLIRLEVNVPHTNSVAAMSDAIISMAEKFLEDLEKGTLKQLYMKTSNGYVVFTKIDDENVVLVFKKSGSNLGMFLHQIDALALKLK